MAVDVGSAVGYLDLDISGFLANLKSAQNEADSASKNIASKLGKDFLSGGKTLTSVGTTLTKNVTVPIVGIGTTAVTASSNFESAMSKVSAISGAAGSDLDKLNKKAQEMGAKTKFSATESAEAFTYMAMAGWKTEDMLSGINGIMSLAAADGLDLATTSDIVTDALTAFGLSASDSGHFADVLAKASSNANTNVSMLGESFKYAAPVAGALGYSAEDTAIALGLMANAGIKGSQGGTALRGSLTRLIKPTDDAAALMEQYGLSMTNADGSMKSLGEVMNMLRDKLGGLTEAEQAQATAQIFGQEAMSGMLAIINASDSDYAKLTDAIYNADGAAQQMADTMLDNLSGQLTLLKSALEGLAIQFSEILMPYIEQFVGWLQSIVQKLQELTPEQKEQIAKWAAIAAAIGPVIVVVGKLITGIGGVISAFGKIPAVISSAKATFTAVSAAIGGISAPVVAVVAVIGVLVAAFVNLWKTNEEFRNNITAIWDQVKATFDELASGIVERLNRLGFDFENIGEVLKAVWEGFCNLLAPVFEGAFQNIANIFDTFVNVFLGTWDFFHALFTGDWEGCWTAVKSVFESIWNGINDWFTNILNVIKGVFDVVLGWFGTSWDECWNGIKSFFEGIWNGIVSFLTGAWNTIKTNVTNAINAVKTVITNVFNAVKTTITNIWNAIKTTITNVWNTIKTTITNVVNSIKTTLTNVWNAIKTTITTVINAIKTTITNVWNSIKSTIANVVNGIKSTVSSVFNAVKSTVSSVFNSIKSTATSVWNGIKSAITTPINAAKSTVSSVVNSIKSTISSGFNAAKNTVSNVFNSIKNSISNVMETAKDIVRNAIDSIRNAFNIDLQFPRIKLPHISIVGSFSLDPPSVPSFSIEWYKKAMNGGMILNGATIFGMDKKGNLLGGGEAGSEVIVGTASLFKMIKQAVYDAVGPLVATSRELAKASAELGYVMYSGFTKLVEHGSKSNETTKRDDSSGGDTFIFNSPKAIDEIEAARQMKKTKRELAEGF